MNEEVVSLPFSIFHNMRKTGRPMTYPKGCDCCEPSVHLKDSNANQRHKRDMKKKEVEEAKQEAVANGENLQSSTSLSCSSSSNDNIKFVLYPVAAKKRGIEETRTVDVEEAKTANEKENEALYERIVSITRTYLKFNKAPKAGELEKYLEEEEPHYVDKIRDMFFHAEAKQTRLSALADTDKAKLKAKFEKSSIKDNGEKTFYLQSVLTMTADELKAEKEFGQFIIDYATFAESHGSKATTKNIEQVVFDAISSSLARKNRKSQSGSSLGSASQQSYSDDD